MSQINVNRIKDSNEGAPDFPSGVNVSGVTSTVTLGVTNLNTTNANVSGVVTATTFDGSLPAAGTPTLGLGVTINASGLNISGVATAGIVSATTLYGDGQYITGIALSIAPLNYNPAVFGVDVGVSQGIGITFNQRVVAGSGNVTLRIAGAAGTVVENFGVGSSVSYSNGDTITITPTSDLEMNTVYHISYPSGAFTNGEVSYVGTAYTFDSVLILNELWNWGWNEYGQLGQNNRTNYSSPVQVAGTNWATADNVISGSYGATFAIKDDGTAWSWGRNFAGALGQNAGANAHKSSPTQVPGTTWSKVQSAMRYFIATKTDGTLWSWGGNAEGKLGHNNQTKYSSPTQIPGTTWAYGDISKISASNHTGAIKTNGTLWMWGPNYKGQLGHNQGGSGKDISSPVQVGSDTTWKSISSGAYHSQATKTDGTLWSWGYNNEGQLGQNTAAANPGNISSPIQIPGTDWNKTVPSGTGYQGGALKTDGSLWLWGANSYGALGQNNKTSYSSPIQIPGSWKAAQYGYVAGAGAMFCLGTKTDGTLWSWGCNNADWDGQLGQNNTINYSSPVQIPGITWNELGIGGHSTVIKEAS